jgi:hypothetical protein
MPPVFWLPLPHPMNLADPPKQPLPPLLPPSLQTSCSSTGAACSASCGAAGCWHRSELRCWTAWALTGVAQTPSPKLIAWAKVGQALAVQA